MMEAELKSVSLGRVCRKIGSGVTPRGGDSVYVSSGVALIRSQNVYNGQFEIDGLVYIDDRQARTMDGVSVQSRDVLLNITGDSVARSCIVPDSVLPARVNQHVAIIRPDENALDPEYLAYCFVTPQMQASMLSLASSGGTRKALTKGMIERFEVPCPDLFVQRKIVDVVRSYDNLIENNRRRIALLREGARLLFREWFVHLRFPGYEHVSSVNGVPTSWQLLTVDDVCHVARGASPRPINLFMEGNIPWLKIGDATASESPFIFSSEEHVTEEGAKRSVRVRPGDLLLSNSATCGVPYFAGVDGCIHDGWLYFSDIRMVSQAFLYWLLHEKRSSLVSSVGDGSTQKNLNTSVVGRLRFLLPADTPLLDQFNVIGTSTFEEINTLARQNIALRRARDLFLPRLMNGEVEV